MDDKLDDMTFDELKEKLKKLKDNLCDLEDMHSFTFNKTSLHIGAEKVQNMQIEFEEECARYVQQIAEVEKALERCLSYTDTEGQVNQASITK